MRRRDLLAATLASGFASAARAAPRSVVIELFTSQGCSSCPPADALLGQLARRPGVIALAWHVDYWDHLGWRDRFASRAATDRQRTYARQLGGGVFTPALVVDGGRVVVGSERGAVEAAIEAARVLPVAVTLSRAGDAVEVGAASRPGARAAHRLRPRAGDRGRRRRERRRAAARVPHRARGRDPCRMGWRRAADQHRRRPVPVRDWQSSCNQPICAFSARQICRPADQGSAAMVPVIMSGSIFQSAMTSHSPSRTTIHTTGTNCA